MCNIFLLSKNSLLSSLKMLNGQKRHKTQPAFKSLSKRFKRISDENNPKFPFFEKFSISKTELKKCCIICGGGELQSRIFFKTSRNILGQKAKKVRRNIKIFKKLSSLKICSLKMFISATDFSRPQETFS